MKSIYRKYFKIVALIWAGSFILLFLMYIFMLSPQKKTKKQLKDRLVEKKQQYDFVQKAQQQETRTQLNQQLEHLRNKLSNFVAEFENSADFTFDISRIANEKRVGSFSIKPKEGRTTSETLDCDYIYENNLDVRFTGGFRQFATLLNALERHRPTVFVDGFTIARSEKNDSGHAVRMNLTTFVRKR